MYEKKLWDQPQMEVFSLETHAILWSARQLWQVFKAHSSIIKAKNYIEKYQISYSMRFMNSWNS